MSVTSTKEQYFGRGGRDGDGERKTKKVYFVTTDDVNDTDLDVLAGATIDGLHENHPDNDELWVDNRKATQIDRLNALKWKVVVNYAKKPPGTSNTANPQPWDVPAKVTTGQRAYQYVMDNCYARNKKDDVSPVPWPVEAQRNLKPAQVANSNDQPFDPPVIIENNALTITIVRAVAKADFEVKDIVKFQDSVNSDKVTVAGFEFPIETLICLEYRTTNRQNNDEPPLDFAEETITVAYKPDGWVHAIVDQGFFIRGEDEDDVVSPGGGGGSGTSTPTEPFTLKAVLDTDDRRITQPVLLDGEGKRLIGDAEVQFIYCHGYWGTPWTDWLPTTYFPS